MPPQRLQVPALVRTPACRAGSPAAIAANCRCSWWKRVDRPAWPRAIRRGSTPYVLREPVQPAGWIRPPVTPFRAPSAWRSQPVSGLRSQRPACVSGAKREPGRPANL